jgi:hypothetical protein
MERDVIDVTSERASHTVGYEPYFTKANPIPTEVK